MNMCGKELLPRCHLLADVLSMRLAQLLHSCIDGSHAAGHAHLLHGIYDTFIIYDTLIIP